MRANLLTLAWRNLGRNRRRSTITGTALAFGMALCIASFGLTDGVNAQMLHSLTRFDLGHVQVHNKEYVEDRDSSTPIVSPARVLEAAEANAAVQAAAPRVYGFALLSSDGKSSGIQVVGVDPARETKVTELHKRIRSGRYLDATPTPWPASRELTAAEKAQDAELTDAAMDEAALEIEGLEELAPLDESPEPADSPDSLEPSSSSTAPDALAETDALAAPGLHPETAIAHRDSALPTPPMNDATRALALAQTPLPNRPPGVIIGSSLAKVLSVKEGDPLFISAATDDGATESVFLEVSGIYQTGTQLHDRHRAYLHIADLRRLLHSNETAHEVSLSLDTSEGSTLAARALESQLSDEQLLVRAWDEVRPDIAQMLKMNDVGTAIMSFIIFFVATLGVVNTMLMAVFERTRELGMLKAIGMSNRRIVALIVLESLLLVLLASLVGVGLGLLLDAHLVYKGLDLSGLTGGISIGGIGVNPVIYGVITLKGVLLPVAVLGTTCLIASLYPAIRASRMQPAVGMRET